MAATPMTAHAGAVAPHLENGLIDVTPKGKYAEITDTNANNSPLLRLLAELRAKIWQYALEGHIILVPSNSDGNSSMVSAVKLSFLPANVHRFSLLSVSRQVYIETAILPYKLSIFWLISWSDLKSWLPRLLVHELVLVGNIRKMSLGNVNFYPYGLKLLGVNIPRLEKVETRDNCGSVKVFEARRGVWELCHGKLWI